MEFNQQENKISRLLGQQHSLQRDHGNSIPSRPFFCCRFCNKIWRICKESDTELALLHIIIIIISILDDRLHHRDTSLIITQCCHNLLTYHFQSSRCSLLNIQVQGIVRKDLINMIPLFFVQFVRLEN